MSPAFSPGGAVAGLALGVGLLLVLDHVRRRRRPTLNQRLEPYLVHRPGGRRGSVFTGHGAVVVVAGRWAERISGGGGTVARRLDQLGGGRTIEQFRAQQVLWGVAGSAVGAGAGLLASLGRGLAVVPVVGLVVVGALTGVLARDQALGLQARRREARMMAEFPAIAELLALAVAAGEGATGALDRVARTGRGELAAELRRTLADARTGTPFVEALHALATRSTLPSLARFVDGVVVALERGTPLADVLRAQAQDVRDLSRRQLMEAGGRREVAMMIPVVFLVLPVTVLFAVYPGLAVLDLNL
jgi:tight adherence protein C